MQLKEDKKNYQLAYAPNYGSAILIILLLISN